MSSGKSELPYSSQYPWLAALLIPLLIVLSAKAGQFLALPPGLATVFWPPSGIILSALILYGLRIWPSILIGALAFEFLFLVFEVGASPYAAITIALGMTIQGLVGYYLTYRCSRPSLALEDPKTIVCFLIWTGPIACLISSTIGALVLYRSGIASETILPQLWLTWWIGDTLSVLVFGPIARIYRFRENNGRRRSLIVGIPAMVLLMVAVFLFLLVRSNESTRIQNQLEKDGEKMTATIEQNFDIYMEDLRSLNAFYESSSNVSGDEFESFTASIFERRKGIGALSWNPVVRDEDRNWFEEGLIHTNPDHPFIRSRNEDGNLARSDNSPFYIPIRFIQPSGINSKAIGFDLYSESLRRKALDLAIQSREPRLTEKLQLVQDNEPFPAIVAFYPLYYNDDAVSSNEMPDGIFSSVIRIDEFMKQVFRSFNPPNSFFTLVDYTDQENPVVIYTNQPDGADHFRANEKPDDDLILSLRRNIAGRNWVFIFEKDPASLPFVTSWEPGYILVGGLGFNVLLIAFLLVVTGHSQAVENLVSIRTKDLKQSNTSLQSEIDQRTKAEEDLIRARQTAEQASTAKGQFLANMSHEIRTPLNAILGMAGFLQDTRLDEKQEEMVGTLITSGRGLLGIVNDILDYSKLEAGKVELRKSPVRLESLIQEINSMLSVVAMNKGLEVRTDLDEALPEGIEADEQRLRQILINLGNNAVKFTNEGVIIIGVKKSGESKIRFEVTDTGIGIPAESHNMLFESFSQVEGHAERRFEGTGLGLAISRTLVELMGGEIGVQSEVGKGSTFWFEIPIRSLKEDQLDSTGNIDAESINMAINASQMKVLLVEDNTTNQQIARMMMNKLGFPDIDVAENGEEALEKITRDDYGLVLMDVQMPVMDGFRATEEIRKLGGKYKTIPIIAMTANVMEGDREKCLQIGMNDYISKPIIKKELIRKLAFFVLK